MTLIIILMNLFQFQKSPFFPQLSGHTYVPWVLRGAGERKDQIEGVLQREEVMVRRGLQVVREQLMVKE